MKRIYPLGPIVFVVASCSAGSKIPASPPAPAVPVITSPQALMPAPIAAVDPTIFGKAGSDLKALGYPAGKARSPDDLSFQRAVRAFEKDEGLNEDGLLTPSLVEKIHAVRVSMRIVSTPKAAVYIYFGHAGREAITLATAPEGFGSKVAPNVLKSLHLGGQFTLTLTRKAEIPENVTCKVGKAVADDTLVMTDTLLVECQGDREVSWRDLFSPRLGAVIKRQVGARVETLVAVRPFTERWPNAARTGLDWAITSALSAPEGAAPVKWSSSAIAVSFEIKASKSDPGSGLRRDKTKIPALCRRFELIETGTNST